jgi:putative tricarboxylic transport membrane protein
MEQRQMQDRHQRGGVTYNAVEAVTAVCLFLIGMVITYDSYMKGAGWSADGPRTGYFPIRIGAFIVISSLAIFLRSLFGKNKNYKIFVEWGSFKQVLTVLVPTAVYVLATQFIGIYVSSSLFIAFFMKVMGRYGWVKIALVSIGTSVALFWMFEMQFLVPLPKGPLEALFGY